MFARIHFDLMKMIQRRFVGAVVCCNFDNNYFVENCLCSSFCLATTYVHFQHYCFLSGTQSQVKSGIAVVLSSLIVQNRFGIDLTFFHVDTAVIFAKKN